MITNQYNMERAMTAVDIQALSDLLSQTLTPYLPIFLSGATTVGSSVLEGFGKKIGETGWQSVTRLWGKIKAQLDTRPESALRLAEAAALQDDPRTASLISWEFEKLLKGMTTDDLIEVYDLATQASMQIRSVTAAGDRSVAIGGDATNSTITTGDKKDTYAR